MTSGAKAEPSKSTEAEWDEARLLSALDRLQNMHIRLRNLRQAISNTVHPMIKKQPSPQTFYTQFAQVAIDTVNNIQDFVKYIGSDRSQEVLNRARISRAENPQGIRGWRVTEHPDWLEVKREDIPPEYEAV